jgi:hypothetical protein
MFAGLTLFSLDSPAHNYKTVKDSRQMLIGF